MKSCTRCGVAVSSEAPAGLCARCLLNPEMLTESKSPVDPAETAPGSPGNSSPAIAMINIPRDRRGRN